MKKPVSKFAFQVHNLQRYNAAFRSPGRRFSTRLRGKFNAAKEKGYVHMEKARGALKASKEEAAGHVVAFKSKMQENSSATADKLRAAALSSFGGGGVKSKKDDSSGSGNGGGDASAPPGSPGDPLAAVGFCTLNQVEPHDP